MRPGWVVGEQSPRRMVNTVGTKGRDEEGLSSPQRVIRSWGIACSASLEREKCRILCVA